LRAKLGELASRVRPLVKAAGLTCTVPLDKQQKPRSKVDVAVQINDLQFKLTVDILKTKQSNREDGSSWDPDFLFTELGEAHCRRESILQKFVNKRMQPTS